MQKATTGDEKFIMNAPVDLPDDFPIYCSGISLKKYMPITHLHIHNCLEIGYCHEGSGIYMIGNKVLPFSAGDVTFISSSELHYSANTPGTVSKWSWILLDPARLLLSVIESDDEIAYRKIAHFSGDSFLNVFDHVEHDELSSIARRIALELNHKEVGYRTTVRCLVYEFIIRLHRLYPYRKVGSNEQEKTALQRISPSLEYIGANYMEKIPVTALSELCHVCVVQYRRLFLRAMGIMPYEYISQVRIQLAKQLLRVTDEPILSIAMQVGFPTLSSFNRQFKRRTGVSPREWIKRRDYID